MGVLYVAADRSRSGATTVIGALAQEAAAAGRSVVAVKPVSTKGAVDGDAGFFAAVLSTGQSPLQPLVPSPEERAGGLSREHVTQVASRVATASAKATSVMVEGLPMTDGLSPTATRMLADALGARILVVAGYRPDLRVEDLVALLRPLGDRLAGVLVNGVTKHRGHEVETGLLPGLRAAGVRVLGAVPEDRGLVAVTVSELAARVEAQWVLNDEFRDKLVEHVTIGGFLMDWGQIYFGRKPRQAVVIRADRPDLQMAALRVEQAPSCLVLTEGPEPFRYEFPAQYVRHEAIKREVPVLRVAASTVETARRLEGLPAHALAHHPAKVERYRSLLRVHADADALLALTP